MNLRSISLLFVFLLVILLFLLINPFVLITSKILNKLKVSLFLDTSLSMEPFRGEIIKSIGPLLENAKIDLKVYQFSDKLKKIAKEKVGELSFHGHESFYFPVYRHLKILSPEERGLVISDFNFLDGFKRETRTNIHYLQVGSYARDIAVSVRLGNKENRLTPGETNTVSILIKKNFDEGARAGLNLILLTEAGEVIKKEKRELNLRKRETEILFKFIPKRHRYYKLRAEIESEDKWNGKGQNDRDFFIFTSQVHELHFLILSFIPDYEIKHFKLFLDKYKVFSYESMDFFNPSLSDGAILNKIKKFSIGRKTFLVLFSPPEGVLEYLRKKDRFVIYFPMKDTQTVNSIFKDAYLKENNPESSDYFNYDYDFFNLRPGAGNPHAVWKSFEPFEYSYYVRRETGDISFHSENRYSSFFLREDLLFLGLYPIHLLKRASIPSEGSYLDNFFYRLFQMLWVRHEDNRSISGEGNNFYLRERITSISRGLKVNGREVARGAPLIPPQKQRVQFYTVSHLEDKQVEDFPIAFRIPLHENFKEKEKIKDNLPLSFLNSLYLDISKRDIPHHLIHKKNYVMHNWIYLSLILVLFILFTLMKRVCLKREGGGG